jgi:hypothetical protein
LPFIQTLHINIIYEVLKPMSREVCNKLEC